MAYEVAFSTVKEYKRLVAKSCILSEDGVYAPGELPEDYEGSFTGEIDICYIIVQVDAVGRLQYLSFNPQDMMNKERETGLPLKAIIGDNSESTVIRAGSAEPAIELEWVESPHLSQGWKRRADQMWKILMANESSWQI